MKKPKNILHTIDIVKEINMIKKINTLKSDFRDNYTFYSSIGILISTMLGSIAIMLVMINGNNLISWIQLGVIVFICGAYNAAVISVQSYKIIFYLIIASLFYNITIITLNIVVLEIS